MASFWLFLQGCGYSAPLTFYEQMDRIGGVDKIFTWLFEM